MATAQTELTTAQTESTTEQTELLEQLNCLEFETSQLNRAYQLWRSYVEQGAAPDWMAAATRVTYDALMQFCLETISALAPATSHADEIERGETAPLLAQGSMTDQCLRNGQRVQCDDAATDHRVRFTALVDPSLVLTPVRQENQIVGVLTAEQSELIEKLNCLEFETSQLNQAYQLWRSYVEQGTIPDWMAAAISTTYDALLKFCLDSISTILADAPHAFSASQMAQLEAAVCEISGILEEERTTAQPSPELLPELLPEPEPDWRGPEMPVATSLPSTGDTISEQPTIQQGQETCNCPECAKARGEKPGAEISGILAEETTTAEPPLELLPEPEPDESGPEVPVAISLPSTSNAISEQPAIQGAQQEEERLGQLWARALVCATAEPAPELLPMTETELEPDWPGPEMLVAISPSSTRDAISERLAVQLAQQEDEAGAEPVVIHIPAVLANWLQAASTSRLFRAASVAIVLVAGFAIGIYLARPHRAALKPAILVQNSASHAAAGVLAVSTGEKAGFKFDPDPVVASLGRSFVLNAVLSRASDIASMAVQIDYDANLLQFKGVSQGGFLVKAGQRVLLSQRDDPSTGVLRISAEKFAGNPGISGDGPVFALSFQARKKGRATVSIVPGAHDSQGHRIEMAGSQVSVHVN